MFRLKCLSAVIVNLSRRVCFSYTIQTLDKSIVRFQFYNGWMRSMSPCQWLFSHQFTIDFSWYPLLFTPHTQLHTLLLFFALSHSNSLNFVLVNDQRSIPLTSRSYSGEACYWHKRFGWMNDIVKTQRFIGEKKRNFVLTSLWIYYINTRYVNHQLTVAKKNDIQW